MILFINSKPNRNILENHPQISSNIQHVRKLIFGEDFIRQIKGTECVECKSHKLLKFVLNLYYI